MPDAFRALLRSKILALDVALAKADVAPFVRDAAALDIWSQDYFLALADKVAFV